MSKLSVHLVTPEKDLAHGDVDEIVAPSIAGEIGVLAEHRSLLASLEPGRLGLVRGGQTEWWAVTGGFIEVDGNAVTVLADSAEPAHDIDRARCQAEISDALKALKTLNPDDADYSEQHARIRRSEVRLAVADLAS